MGKPKTVDCCTKCCIALLAISNHTDHCEHVGPWQVSYSKGGHYKQNQLNKLIYGENTHLENSQFRTLALLFGPWWQFLIVNTSSVLLQVVFFPCFIAQCKAYKYSYSNVNLTRNIRSWSMQFLVTWIRITGCWNSDHCFAKELAWTLKDRHRKPKSTNNEIVLNKNNSRTNQHINIGWKI